MNVNKLISLLPLCLLALPAVAAAPDSVLAKMNGTWRVENPSVGPQLTMTIDADTKNVTVSNGNVSRSDKFTVGLEEGDTIILIARDHGEAMYFEIKDRNTMITKTDSNTVSKTLKRVR